LRKAMWFIPVILVMQEAEIRRIMIALANTLQDPISKIPNKKQGWWSDSSATAPA
jgi:hypothetical protein